MRGQQLRELLSVLRRTAGATGSAQHEVALSKLEEAIVPHDELELGEVLASVESAANQTVAPIWEQHLLRMLAAGLDEPAFLRALAQLEDDTKVKKADLQKITERYVGLADKKANAEKLLNAIKTEFYAKVYARDANEMAKRATPW